MIPSIELMALTFVCGGAAGGILASVGWSKHYDRKLDNLATKLAEVAVENLNARRKLSAGGNAKARNDAARRMESAQRTVDELSRSPLPPRDEVVAGVADSRRARLAKAQPE